MFTACRSAIADGVTARGLGRDVLAGLLVGVVALPLSMALAIGTGMPPQAGLYTAIVGGVVAAIFGGSRVQVTGPTAAFIVILVPVVAQFGVAGLMIASMAAGVALMALGFFRMGRLVEYIPFPVTAGFTLGIAVSIAILQLKDMFGLTIEHSDSAIEKLIQSVEAFASFQMGDAILGVSTLMLLIVFAKFWRKIPAALVVLPLVSLLAIGLGWLVPAWQPATIASRFHTMIDGVEVAGIPQAAPHFAWPWIASAQLPAIDWSYDTVRGLLRAAVAIALLGAIESLLSAVIADGVTGKRHDPDGELVGQGLANVIAPLFGGFAATGALARTAANIRAGATTPLASIVHAVFLLAAVLALAPLLGYLPMASLAALLVMVAWGMSDLRHCVFVVRTAPLGDSATLLICFLLTVVFDMVVAVGAGFVLASILFMRRMSELSAVELNPVEHGETVRASPAGILYYRIRGPLFFGAAQRAMSEVQFRQGEYAAVVDLTDVPMIDATGIVNLESAINRLKEAGIPVALTGVQSAAHEVLEQAGFAEIYGGVRTFDTAQEAFRVLESERTLVQ
ncbi:MAG: STAS domain-containing protein [Planctomycetes bacterium]|nr:STAS domain-containing protein [Planctomycetota bacterium]